MIRTLNVTRDRIRQREAGNNKMLKRIIYEWWKNSPDLSEKEKNLLMW